MHRKEIEGISRRSATGLQRGLNGSMKGSEREESSAQALGSWSSALGGRFFRVACSLICVGVASMTSFMDEGTAGNMRGQLVGSGDWVQVAGIFTGEQKYRNQHASGKDEACWLRLREEKG